MESILGRNKQENCSLKCSGKIFSEMGPNVNTTAGYVSKTKGLTAKKRGNKNLRCLGLTVSSLKMHPSIEFLFQF